MSLTLSLHKHRREAPRELATVCGPRRRTYGELADRVARVAGALRGLGVAPGDRVAVLAVNSDRYLEVLFGAWWAGAVVNPVNVRWAPREIAYSLDDCETSVLVVDDAFVETARALRAGCRSLRAAVHAGDGAAPEGMIGYEALLAGSAPLEDVARRDDDLAVVLYTGGTTGTAKGVMLTHGNLQSDALLAMATVPREFPAVALVAAPMFHVAALSYVIQMVMRACRQVLLPGFEEAAVLGAVERERVADTFLVPTMLKRLLDHPRFATVDVSSLKVIRYGASPMDAALLSRALERLPGVGFSQAYGMTELSPTITLLSPWYHTPEGQRAGKLRSAGRPLPLAEVRIVDPAENDVPPGVVGEIVARGPMMMVGYWNKPELTAHTLRGGWMHTGDAGYLDEDGFLFVVDRIKDMIVTGGENVYSAEVENAILQLPEVSQCAVIGVPDDRWGERVHAVVVPRDGAALDAAAIVAHCRTLIAGYKCPRTVEFRTELPMSAAGKLLKFRLREPYWRDRSRAVN